jgi:hypothetical protein
MCLQDLRFSVDFSMLVYKFDLERPEFYINRIVLKHSTPSGHGGGSNFLFSDQSNHFGLPPHRVVRRDLNRLLQKIFDIMVQQRLFRISVFLMILDASINTEEYIVHVLWVH